MKKILTMTFFSILCAGMLSGCGTDYDTADSTVFAFKDGSIVSTDVEKFDTGTYDKDDLEKYVNSEIDSYNKSDDGDVKLKSLDVEDGKAHLTVSYGSSKEYSAFNGTDMFCGTIAEALAAGYDFDAEFASIEDGKAKSCDKKDFIDSEGYKVVIYKGTSNIHVESDILFSSVDNVKLVDDKTVAVGSGYDIFNQSADSTENTEAAEPVSQTQSTESTESTEASGGSVSDDDILNAVIEEQEVTFDFDKDDNEEEASYITYIIFK